MPLITDEKTMSMQLPTPKYKQILKAVESMETKKYVDSILDKFVAKHTPLLNPKKIR
jgi:hypothetical protein